MRTTFRPAIVAAGCALAVSAAQTTVAQADSVLTINPDGSVAQVESPPGGVNIHGDASLYQGDASAFQDNSAWTNTPVAGANSTASWGTQNWGTQGWNRSQGWSANPGWGATQGWNAAQGWNGSQAAGVRSRPYQNRDSRRPAGSIQQPGFAAQGDAAAQGKVVVRPGRNDRDIIIDGDNNKIVIRPGRGAYYPPYYGGWVGYPPYGYPPYGYPGYYPPPRYYGYYGYPTWGGYQFRDHTSWPGFGGSYWGFNGSYGGMSIGRGGVNITLGADRDRVRSRSERTITSDATGSNLTPSPFIMPNNNTPVTGGFVMPNKGSQQVIQRGAGSGRASRR